MGCCCAMAVGKAGSCLTVDDDCLAAAVPASSLQRTAKNEKLGGCSTE